jgi:hypothetical protein
MPGPPSASRETAAGTPYSHAFYAQLDQKESKARMHKGLDSNAILPYNSFTGNQRSPKHSTLYISKLMSWNHSEEYTCISFDRVVPEKELRLILAELSVNLLDRHLSKADCLDQLEDIAYEIENGKITREQALEQAAEISYNFLRNIDHTAGCTSVTVLAEYDSEYYDADMAQEIAKHLFAKTNESHFIWHTAAFDRYGSYSHQWIGFWQDGKIELVHTDEYFTKQFAIPAAA